MPRNPHPSLAHRLVDRQLAFGLACVFAGLLIAIQVAMGESLNQVIVVAVAVALMVLLLGSWTLRHTVRVPGSIDAQLRAMADAAVSGGEASLATCLRPLKEAGPVAAGWNRILHTLERHETAASLTDRLNEALGAAQGSRWETAFQNLSDGIAITNESGGIEAANSAFLGALRLPMDASVTGRNIHELLEQWTAGTPNAMLPPLLNSQCKITCELQCGAATSDGVLRVARVALAEPQGRGSDASSHGRGSVWTIRDVTQQRLSEEMRNEFVSMATHELRTPLANIKAYAETLAMNMDLDIEKQKGFFNIINGEATRLSRFIDELLDVSQMESGAISVIRHETDVERLLHEVLENVQPQAQQKRLRVEHVLPPKLPKIRADKDKLVAALVNLLGNAVKYTPEGGEVRLIVELDQQYLHLHVDDTGIGIDPKEVPRIGEKFFRSDDQRIREIPGSGLGVAFAQEVARLHGGKMTIRSKLNEGSRFTLSLPVETER